MVVLASKTQLKMSNTMEWQGSEIGGGKAEVWKPKYGGEKKAVYPCLAPLGLMTVPCSNVRACSLGIVSFRDYGVIC